MSCSPDFSPIQDPALLERLEHIEYKSGDVVFWDWRLPHANSYCHLGDSPREVIYAEFLPNVKINEAYAKEQLERYRRRVIPSDQWQPNAKIVEPEKDRVLEPKDLDAFSTLGKQLMGAIPW